MSTSEPQRRPAIQAVSFDDVGEAIGRLLAIARSDTGQAARVADFLLAWWDGGTNGHFPLLHLSNCDPTIGEDMVIIMAYLTQQPVESPHAWGFGAELQPLCNPSRTPNSDLYCRVLTQC